MDREGFIIFAEIRNAKKIIFNIFKCPLKKRGA